jgi:protein O-mannosyl-transferase
MKNIKNNRTKQPHAKETSLYVYLLLLVVIPLTLNWKIISYNFTSSDDTIIIKNNYSFLSDIRNVFQAFAKDNFISKTGQSYYRPVQTVSFIIDTQMNGDRFYSYHLSNLIYHILTVITLFFLLRKLKVKDNISFFLSLLFSVHPLLTDAIAWIPGRGDLLSGLFCTVSFHSFINYNIKKNKIFFFFHSAAFLLALFSKEISVILPVILMFYFWFELRNKHKIRELVPFVLIWSFCAGLFFLLRYINVNNQNMLSIKAFIFNLPVIPIFLGKILVPINLSPLPTYNILFTLIGLILIITSCIYLQKSRIRNKSLIVLGGAWFLGFIIPAMIVTLPFVKVHFDYLECRSYLPSIGIFLALGVFLNEIITMEKINISYKIFIPLIMIFSLLSYNYSRDYVDGVSFFSSLLKSNPGDAYAYRERGSNYLAENKIDLALKDFDNSIRISPTYSRSYYYMGAAYALLKDHIQAEHFFSVALNYDTLYPGDKNLDENVYINLSLEKLSLRKYDDNKVLLNKAIRQYPDNSKLHYNLGLTYYFSEVFDSAISEYSGAINLDKNISSYYNDRGLAEYHLNDFTNALKDFNKTLELNPDFHDAWGSRGMVKIRLDDNVGAISDLTAAISLNPGIGSAYYFRGIAYSKLNRINEARRDLEKANELGFKGIAQILNNYKP